MRRRKQPIGVILAGGMGRRIGGSKAIVELCGQPLISYPLQAMAGALREVVIVAKADTRLPNLAGVSVWIEPTEPRHPLVGIVHALALADGRPVLVCAADLPFVTHELIGALARTDPHGAPAVLAAHQGETQPLLGCYRPSALGLLSQAAGDAKLPLRQAVSALRPRLLEVDDAELLFNVNAPDDLLQAAAMLDRRRAARASRT
jgi:molybdopterin-guanine dinucleotide biosynthesis protein A